MNDNEIIKKLEISDREKYLHIGIKRNIIV